jgi:hypothetical protein
MGFTASSCGSVTELSLGVVEVSVSHVHLEHLKAMPHFFNLLALLPASLLVVSEKCSMEC